MAYLKLMKATPSGPLLNGYSLLSRWNISLSLSLPLFLSLLSKIWSNGLRIFAKKKKVFQTEPRQLPVEYYKYHLPRNRENVVFPRQLLYPSNFLLFSPLSLFVSSRSLLSSRLGASGRGAGTSRERARLAIVINQLRTTVFFIVVNYPPTAQLRSKRRIINRITRW